ncbi:MAG: radical SAM protein, partial [Bacteroidaceae bacterium]|nr:radical SAM protein [Bacteroidaceae bacterium]
MNIGLIAVDSTFPNLALMKIARYHRDRGDIVEWYTPFDEYDKVYMSKVFSYTEDYGQYITNAKEVIKGGTGYDLTTTLPDEIDRLQPDYSIYPSIDKKTAYGFLTRGCPNRCKWCVVPKKEGKVKPYMDVDDIAIDGRTNLILMDNNILASDYGLQQIQKIIDRRYRVDFNQALDARLVTPEIGKLLAQVRWLTFIRFGCDTPKQIKDCERAMALIDAHRKVPGSYLMYTMISDDMQEAYHRLS